MARARPYSLRRRLLFWLLVPLLAIGALALIDTWHDALATANSVSDRVLAGSALAIAERVVVSETGQLEVDVPYVALEMLTSAAQDRVFYRVDGPPGTFVTGYQGLPTSTGNGAGLRFSDMEFRGEPIRLAVLERSASSGVSAIPFVVTVAETTIARTQLAQAILGRSAIRLALLIVSAAIIVWFAVSASLSPLYRLRDAIANRSQDDLSPIDQSVPREVQELVDTINSFMRRLGSAIDGLRHFTGNASHQLRTPLTIIGTQLTLASRAQTAEAMQAAARIGLDEVGNAERILTQLLLLARIDQAASHSLTATKVDLVEIARTHTTDAVMRARSAGIDLGFEADGTAPIFADAMLLGEMIRNLIDNAIAYAGTGAEATVRVVTGETIVLEVEDTGPGIDPADFAMVLERFSRGAHPDAPGAGLGLPIVDEVARLFDGQLTLHVNAPHGLKVRLSFPAAAR